MSLERTIMAFAGVMVLLSLALTYFVHPSFVWFTALVGANLLQSALTGFCPVGILLRRFGVKTEREQLLQGEA